MQRDLHHGASTSAPAPAPVPVPTPAPLAKRIPSLQPVVVFILVDYLLADVLMILVTGSLYRLRMLVLITMLGCGLNIHVVLQYFEDQTTVAPTLVGVPREVVVSGPTTPSRALRMRIARAQTRRLCISCFTPIIILFRHTAVFLLVPLLVRLVRSNLVDGLSLVLFLDMVVLWCIIVFAIVCTYPMYNIF